MNASRIAAIGSALTLTAALLAGCSNGKFDYATSLNDLRSIAGLGVPSQKAAAIPAPSEPGPPLLVGFENIRVAIPYAGPSGPSKTYVAEDGVTIAMNSGFVTRATGIGFDMNASYLPQDSGWLTDFAGAAKAGASADRIVEYWKQGRIERDQFHCTLSAEPRPGGGLVVDESCKRYFEPSGFDNRYWLDTGGQIECSRQWIHPRLSPLQFFRTRQQAQLDLTKQGC